MNPNFHSVPESNRRRSEQRPCASDPENTHGSAYGLAMLSRAPQAINKIRTIINNRRAAKLPRSASVPERSCQRVITHTAEPRVPQNSKSRRRDAESARDLSDPSCEMENGSPAKPSGGSCVGQIYIIKRINTRRSPSTSRPRPHGPDAHMHFIWSSPLSEPHGLRLDI